MTRVESSIWVSQPQPVVEAPLAFLIALTFAVFTRCLEFSGGDQYTQLFFRSNVCGASVAPTIFMFFVLSSLCVFCLFCCCWNTNAFLSALFLYFWLYLMAVEIPLWVEYQVWQLKVSYSRAKWDVGGKCTAITKFCTLKTVDVWMGCIFLYTIYILFLVDYFILSWFQLKQFWGFSASLPPAPFLSSVVF